MFVEEKDQIDETLYFCSTCSLDFPSYSYLRRHRSTKTHQHALQMEQNGRKVYRKKIYVRKNKTVEKNLHGSGKFLEEEMQFSDIFKRNQNSEEESTKTKEILDELSRELCNYRKLEEFLEFPEPKKVKIDNIQKVLLQSHTEISQPITVQPVQITQPRIIKIPQKFFIIPKQQRKFCQSVQQQLKNIFKTNDL